MGRRPCLPGLQHPLPRHPICRDGAFHPLPGNHRSQKLGRRLPRPPTKLATKNLPLLLSQLDQYWDLAPEPVLKQIREVLLKSDQPLAREAAARAIGHMADPGSLPDLMQALGDETKMVQSSAAYAVRMILSRRQDAAPEGRKLLIAALGSPNPRTRWGAARVFNQHFRDLTGDPELLAALEKRRQRPRALRPLRSRLRLMALVLLAGRPAGDAPQHPRNPGHPPQRGDRRDGPPRPAGEYLRPARREHRLPHRLGPRQRHRRRQEQNRSRLRSRRA